MAYHFANDDLSEVKGIDALDSCAYTVLAALYSVVEPKLIEKLTATREKTALRKGKDFAVCWQKLRGVPDKVWFTADYLGPVLGMFGVAGGKLEPALKRVEGNAKLNFFWKKAVTGLQPDFPRACAVLMANLDAADLPGNQCTAVVRDNRTIYVTGNGLWESAETLAADRDAEPAVDTPWFSSAQTCQAAFDELAVSIKVEYNVDKFVFLIPTLGDVGGKFHAEMQLLEYMLDNRIFPERGYIGVSKPCCKFCQENLAAAGLLYWTGHSLRGENPNTRVAAPYTSYKDAKLLEQFKAAIAKVPFYGLHGQPGK